MESDSRSLLRVRTLAARARQAATASAQILKAGNTTARGSKTANVPSKTVTLTKKARITKRESSPFDVLRGRSVEEFGSAHRGPAADTISPTSQPFGCQRGPA